MSPGFRRNCRPSNDGIGFGIRRVVARKSERRRVGPLSVILKKSPARCVAPHVKVVAGVVKVDPLVREMIQNDETKEPFVPLPGSLLFANDERGFQGQGCA
jgi:hypothetical protein